MPGKDKSGPQGAGPMTGRRMGYCADNENQSGGFFGRGRRFGSRQGYGRGFGTRGNMETNLPFESDEKSILENQIDSLKNQLGSLVKEVMELKNKS